VHNDLRETESVKTHTLAPIKGSQYADRGCEVVSSSWDKHQPFPLIRAGSPL